ncbi:unnamed protein product [Cylicocyclus nassatus]|uniref:Uncharacterized protein n=1 Tax=Cylicocyclus nassatus TaxID=53992 RepID=A0AA36MC47_CYLNA|nr:unnamed protein product [Cylicocyclus nassatus]
MWMRCIALAALMKVATTKCEIDQLSDCTRCCSILFSTPDCDPKNALRIRINGNGVLGAVWDDAPVAAIVKNGCLLELWDFRNQTGSHRAFGLDGYEVYQFDRYGYEMIASSARCTCINSS